MSDFYVPKFRWELISLLKLNYPEDKDKFSKMKKKQLYAIYCEMRKEQIKLAKVEGLLRFETTGCLTKLVKLIWKERSMFTYLCSNGKRKREFKSKHQLKVGDTIIGRRSAKYTIILQRGIKCLDTQSAKIAGIDIVRNAVLVAEEWKRSNQLREQ
jgi:hypothetical protein